MIMPMVTDDATFRLCWLLQRSSGAQNYLTKSGVQSREEVSIACRKMDPTARVSGENRCL